MGGKVTTSANTVVRIRGTAKKTQSNQVGPREASPHTRALAGNVRRHQGDALAVFRTSGHHGLRHGEVEGDEPSGARHI